MPTTPPIELLLSRARLWSPGGVPSGADAVAVAGGRIVAVGRTDDLRAAATPSTRNHDLGGAMLLPGFQDSHVHPVSAGVEAAHCDLSGISGVDAYRDAIRAYAASHPDAPWITGSGWDMSAFPGGNPSLDLLDGLAGDRPVFLFSRDGHSAWVDRHALALAGIGDDTPDPPLGRIERDPDGHAMGTLHEHACDLVAALVPEPTAAEMAAGLRRAQARLHAWGVTAWTDAAVDGPALATYLRAEADGWLTGRVNASLEWLPERGMTQVADFLEQRATVPAGSRVRASTVKIFQDGIVENRTAAVLEPYLDPATGRATEERGVARLPPDEFAAVATRLEEEGFDIHVHAIGDRAVRESLDAVAAARRRHGARDFRHHLAHIQLIDPDDIPRFAALDVTANAQPFWAVEDEQVATLNRPILGDERTDRMYPFASLLRSGARLAMGSDWNVTTADVLAIMDVAVRRIPADDPDREPFIPGERLTLEQALSASTRGSAHVARLDTETAELAPGRRADLVVLDTDLLADDAPRPGLARVRMTFVDGTMVHGPEASPSG